MSRVGDQSQWTAEQTLAYITNLVAADDNQEDEDQRETLFIALSISYEYLTNSIKRKITWSLHLQKLAYEFIELAFITNMHASIKEVFKSYRSLTQGQYSESLKYVLEHYRDKKLEAILIDEITEQDLSLIRGMPNIQSDEISSELILSSFRPELKQKQISLKNKLRIVWEGYKSIVETVRVNQKLQDVYMATLLKIFEFVERYNRKHEFKLFCKTLRSGLQNAFNKRDKTEQQKAIYIDIEKTDVNTRNIEIRLEQFKVATKLGLWQQAFQVLEDINNIMHVRRAPLKNSLKCSYFENLALLFKKSSYWHYHAFACFNGYLAYLTNPRITSEEKRNYADKLLLSVLCIPPVTFESRQSKESQDKICSMMISSTKIPGKSELFEMMASKGVVENASAEIKELWNFMFLEFNLSSLKQGLDLLEHVKGRHSQFRPLIQNILLYRQLISIAQVYQRIKFDSLLRLIPLPREKVELFLLQCHQERVVDLCFDESQGIVIFQDKSEQANPYDEFHSVFLSVALAKQNYSNPDEKLIKKQAATFIEEANEYFWKIRQYKIEEFRKKLKQPKQDLKDKERLREKEQRELRERLEDERKAKENQARMKAEEAKRVLARKKIVINDIIAAKEKKTVRIINKKIENLTDEQIDNLTMEVLNGHLTATQKRIANNKEAKFKKMFTYVDYYERERRLLLNQKLRAKIPTEEEEASRKKAVEELAVSHFQERKYQSEAIRELVDYLKEKISHELQIVNQRYEKEIRDYKTKIDDNFRDKIRVKAMNLFQDNKRKKEEALNRTEAQEAEYRATAVWTRNTNPREGRDTPSIGFNIGKNFSKREQFPAPSPSMTGFIKKANPFEGMEDRNEKWTKGKIQTGEPDESGWKHKEKDSAQVETQALQIGSSFKPSVSDLKDSAWTKKTVPQPEPSKDSVWNKKTAVQPEPSKDSAWSKKPVVQAQKKEITAKKYVNVNSDKKELKKEEIKKQEPKKEEPTKGRKFA